jgi:hypothetical protein
LDGGGPGWVAITVTAELDIVDASSYPFRDVRGRTKIGPCSEGP